MRKKIIPAIPKDWNPKYLGEYRPAQEA